MYQSFDVKSDKSFGQKHVPLLRAELKVLALDGFFIPHADEYQNEYLPSCGERLCWATGFSGSAGTAIILSDKAVLFIDGRYTIQSREQVDADLFEFAHLVTDPPLKWIEKNLPSGAKLGYDPWLHTIEQVEDMRKACKKAGAELIACETNPIDTCWDDQPEKPLAKVIPHEVAFAGESSESKRIKLGEDLKEKNIDAYVVTKPESVAWLLNVRGGDVSHTPLPLSRAILYADGQADFFVDSRKLAPELERHLGNAVTIQEETEFGASLRTLGGKRARVSFDPAAAPAWVYDQLEAANATVVRGKDPCVLPRSCKNEVEQEGMRQAHIRDGVAMAKFLAWMSVEAPKGKLTEISAAQHLEGIRDSASELTDLSFGTISASGPNAALPHYSVTEESNRRIELNSIYLVDSGGQYKDGTTDITRTIVVGTPTEEMKDRFTRVLKGHIGISDARFPEGTMGGQLDVLARAALWKAGLNYDHGTGHGVGSYLGVHEGPQSIAPGPRGVAHALKSGMILSNEPGYYKEGDYGIRIENLLLVTPLQDIGGDRPMHGFEPMTFAPIDLNLVVPSLLTDEEHTWLNEYHAKVWEKISPFVDDITKAWLKDATRAV